LRRRAAADRARHRLDVDLFMMIPHELITQENYKSYFDR
jgi:hypothetical protein